MTDVELLKQELQHITYPENMQNIDCGIKGEGFFPGSRGLWANGDETVSDKPVMILGHDFGTKAYYGKCVALGKEVLTDPTWRNLIHMLKLFGIEKEQCFFTNAVLGVRTSGGMIDVNPADKDQRFLGECRNVLLKQIELQKPKLIIALGKHTISFLAPLVKPFADLSKIKTFTQLDAQGFSGLEGVSFEHLSNYKTNIAFLTHPCIWHGNVGRRRYKGIESQAAEIELVKQLKVF